jgi:scyllo-inositol 2-dehydrogenase (NADP+)
MAKRLRVGIIGQGRSGRDIHAHVLSERLTDLFEIVAVADVLPDRCDRAAKELGCRVSTEYRDLLDPKGVDLVVNASPSHLHVPITREALAAGCNVLCEKPFARRAREVDGMIAAARRARRFLAVFQQSRFGPYYRKVREIVDSGLLGRIVEVRISFSGFGRRWDWQTLQEYNGGSLLNTGPHPMDQALQFIGTDAMPRVFARFDRAVTWGDAEDHVKIVLSRPGRPIVDLEISSCNPYNSYNYQIFGTQGGLTGTMHHLDWKWFDPSKAPAQHLVREPLPGPSFCTETLPWQTGSWDFPKSEGELYDDMAEAFYRNLHAAFTEGAPLAVPLEHVRMQIAVIEECHRQNPLPRMAS